MALINQCQISFKLVNGGSKGASDKIGAPIYGRMVGGQTLAVAVSGVVATSTLAAPTPPQDGRDIMVRIISDQDIFFCVGQPGSVGDPSAGANVNRDYLSAYTSYDQFVDPGDVVKAVLA